jgi:Papain-like cysteine protease AvrRpt2
MPTIDFSTVPLRFHQQDDPTYCGEAVIQMLLLQLQASSVKQSDLHAEANTNGLLPNQVADLLNHYASTPDRMFVPRDDAHPEDTMRRIFASLKRTAIAVPAFVIDGQHWIAVTGVAFDSATDAIRGLFVHDPEPEVPHSGDTVRGMHLPPPHDDTDTCGIPVENGGNIFGAPNRFITDTECLALYFRGECSVVCAEIPGSPPNPGFAGTAPPRNAEQPSPSRNPAVLADRVNEMIDEYGLRGPGSPFESVLRDARAVPGSVSFVNRIRKTKRAVSSSEDYYVIDVRGAAGRVAAARVGADTGRVLSLQPASSRLPTPSEIYDLAVAALRGLDETWAARVDLDRGDRFTVHPDLVWGPCLQSMSPFSPFVLVNFAEQRLYIDMNGRVYPDLTEHPRPEPSRPASRRHAES